MKQLFLLVICGAVFLLGCTKTEQSANANGTPQATAAKEKGTQKTGYGIGDEATDFKLKNVDGQMVSLADYADAKGFVVIFTCNHCPYAVAYEDRIIALQKEFEAKGYPVVAINPNDPAKVPEDSFEAMQKRAREKGFNFAYLFDEGQEIYPQYGATKTPHVFLLNKEEGKHIVRYIGAIDNNYADESDVSERYLADAVNALLQGGKVPTETTKAIGCSIKVVEK